MLDTVLTQWIARLVELGASPSAFLNAPATDAAIAGAEAELGLTFSDELRQLYRIGDGQREEAETGSVFIPLFGGYDFLPLARACHEYRVWADVLAGWGGEGFEDLEPSSPHEFVTRRGDDPVAAEYWRAGWFPFAKDGGGNAYAADFAPLPGGTYGQVILFGPDEDERRVLAPGIAAMLATAVARPFGPFERGDAMLFFDIEDQLRPA